MTDTPDPLPTANEGHLEFHFADFHNLMPNRVETVLLVCSLYESYIFEEDGHISELIITEFLDMNLSHAPRVIRVSNSQEALDYLRQRQVDLVISMTQLGRRNLVNFAQQVKDIRADLPVIALVHDATELARQPGIRDRRFIDGVFVWTGDARMLLAIIKFVEDKLNAAFDTRTGDVRVIILVENSIRFFSNFLPLIYTEVMRLTQSLMREGINPQHRLLRMRARPKILLAETYEEACTLFSRYHENLLGVISDVRFPRDGALDSRAGLAFTQRVKEQSPHLPVLLQSSDGSNAEHAATLGAAFVNKRSRRLLQQVRAFLLSNMGFGEFVFTLPDGHEVGRAHDLRSFEEMLAVVPAESIAFHAQHNHFSNWFMARTEFGLASRIRPRRAEEFASPDEIRRYLVDTMAEFRERTQGGIIADFSATRFSTATRFTRIGGGSIGGKARGLAFIRAVLKQQAQSERFSDVTIAVPNTAVLGTDVFEAFIVENHLDGLVAEDVDDRAIAEAFLSGKIPGMAHADLAAFLRLVRYPLAVRSSSMLEDSHDRPFAGIYATYMLPNNHPDLDVRLDQLCDAIKLVYASTFTRAARRYLEVTGHHAEEEKMAVILQEIVGARHGDRFYPSFSGVARSYNYYPAAHAQPEDGVAYVALGLGKTVVDGGECIMFSPAQPDVLPQFATVHDMVTHSQRHFYALDVSRPKAYPTPDENGNLLHCGLDVAEKDGTLAPIGSVFSPENDAVYDGIHLPGPRLVTFAHVLKSDLFPLADILRWLLKIGAEGMGCPVEIEFAVDLRSKPRKFGFLQIRPIISDEEYEDVRLDALEESRIVCFSPTALGNGRIHGVQDVVFVDPERFDSAKTPEMAEEVGRINEKLLKENRHCVLIGPGRWGTSDRWLGVPATWEQISSAKVLVETSLRDFIITPSQGTHFFQNLTSLRIGYLAVNPTAREGVIHWKWLMDAPLVTDTKYLRHVRFPRPLDIRFDGRHRRGAILTPSPEMDGSGTL